MSEIRNSLVLCGGGIDSYVAAWDNQLQYEDERTVLLYVNYGAKARYQEANSVRQLAREMNKRFKYSTVVRIYNTNFWSEFDLISSLTDTSTKINRNPTAGVAHEWVPARNTVLMALALAIAENGRYARIVCGINKTAAVAYPDNSMAWLNAYQVLAHCATNDHTVKLSAPVGDLEKYQIIDRAYNIGMTQEIIEKSWSCYDIGKLHCGECSSCRARKEAFRRSVWFDPTKYEV